MGARMIAPRIAFASSDITFSSVKKNPEPVTLREGFTSYGSAVFRATQLRPIFSHRGST